MEVETFQMPRLLIISPYFPPSAASGSFRMLGFACHLPVHGWQVSIVASGPLPWQSDDSGLLRRVPPATQVRYVEFPLNTQRSLWALVMQRLRIFRGMYLWNAPARRASREIIERERPDIILTSGPPHTVHLIGRALQRRHRLPWVADFRDPWCSWGRELHYGRKYGGVSKLLESKVFRCADLIIANTTKMAEMFSEAYPASAGKIVAIPNGFDPFESEKGASDAADPNTIRVVHTGVIYVGRDPRPVAEAIGAINNARLLGERNLHLKLLGQCLDAKLQQDLDAQGLSKFVEMHEHVPHHVANRAVQSADLLLLLDTPGRRIGVPAKLYEYVGARRPILALAEEDGDTALVLKKSRLPHDAVSDWTSQRLQQSLLSLIRNRGAHDDAHVEAATAEFTREAGARQLAGILEQLIG